MDVDFQFKNGQIKLIELENSREKYKKKRKTLVAAEENFRKVVKCKISGKLGLC